MVTSKSFAANSNMHTDITAYMTVPLKTVLKSQTDPWAHS